MTKSLILASSSATRRRLLKNAGVVFKSVSHGVNESQIKTRCKTQKMAPAQAARALALAKANAVSARFPSKYILGSDQLLICNGKWFDKPKGIEGARKTLAFLSGQSHDLVNATVIVKGGRTLWHHNNTTPMKMRFLTAEFINVYIDHAGGSVYQSPGAYNFEGQGIQLLKRAGGDYFSILGMPLLPLLDFLRECGIMPN